jgi:uncharacterized SAM-binding protein YcdF (DUF218 family)
VRVRVVVLACVVIAAAALIGREPILQAVGDFLVVSDLLQKGDAVIAIGGDGPERVATAMQLVREGYGEWLIVSGGPYARGLNSGHLMRDQALAAGMPAARLLVDDQAESTSDNARGSARLMEEHRLTSAVLLTSPYHTRRAGMIFGREFGRRRLAVRVMAVDDGHFRAEQWWTREFERRLVVREYGKLVLFLGGIR